MRALRRIATRLAAGAKGRTEAEIQADVRAFLLEAPLCLQTDDLEVSLEAPVATRKRIDVEVGLTVIEVKRSLSSVKARNKATRQLAEYVQERTEESGQRYVGILTDGSRWLLFHLLPGGSLDEVSSFALRDAKDAEGLVVWLENVVASVPSVPPTPEEIVRRLGAGSPAAQLDLADLRAIYEECRHSPEVALKRQLWAKLLTSALGSRFPDTDELFVLHTYLVITAELIAHTMLDIPIEGEKPEALLSGQVFRLAELRGVVDADFFDWPARAPGGERFVSALARRLGRFAWSSVEHDILKALYQSIIDSDTRKKLGEYYTPDWLAEGMVAEAVERPLSQRVLDPACGSGTFLFWAARRYLAAAENEGLSNAQAIEGLVGHVAGIDLHPVAVALARVTYLLAIGTERLQGERPAFSVPVYLGDSLGWEQDETLFAKGGITILTGDDPRGRDPELHFPEGVVTDANRFDQLIADLSDRASRRKRGAPPGSLNSIFRRYEVGAADRSAVATAFASLCRLHDEGRNHIWGYYARNLARPFFFKRAQNRVEVLLGNPPWLSYRFMPKEMQERYKVLAKERGLWTGGKVATHQDLADLFVVRAIEQYLAKDGDFAFVMPAATLSRKAFEGFRTGHFNAPGALTQADFKTPWDLRAVRPAIFPMPACIVFGSRRDPAGALPEEATVYSGSISARGTRWEEALTQLAFSAKTVSSGVGAMPVSPYAGHFRQGATIVPSALLRVKRLPAGPLGAPHGQVRVRSLRSSLEKDPWKSLESMEGFVEEEFVQPVLLGSGIVPFRTLSFIDAVVPWRAGSLMDSEDPRLDDSPGLARWWRAAEEEWEVRKGGSNRLTLRERFNFHRGIESQYPRARHRVLYTQSGNQIAACRLEASDALIEHKLYWASVGSKDEAHFLAAVLNSSPLHDLVEPLMSEGLFGKRDIDKYVFQAPIPIFDRRITLHAETARLGAQAEAFARGFQLDSIWGFQKSRREIRKALSDHGISSEIDRTVAELLGTRSLRSPVRSHTRVTGLLDALSAAEKQANAGTKKARRKPTRRAVSAKSAKKKRAASTRRMR